MDPEYAPVLHYTGLDNPALGELAEYVSKLVTATVVTPTIEMERELLKRAGLPHGHLVTPQDEARALQNAETADEMLAAIGYTPDGVPDPTRPTQDTEEDKVELNGIQIESIVTVLTAAASGALPRDSALALVMAVGLSREKAEEMLADIGKGFVPSGAPVMGPDGKPMGGGGFGAPGGGQPLNPAPNGTAPAPGQSHDELIRNAGMNPAETPPLGDAGESKDETKKAPPK
jgi:hypothetical protein